MEKINYLNILYFYLGHIKQIPWQDLRSLMSIYWTVKIMSIFHVSIQFPLIYAPKFTKKCWT